MDENVQNNLVTSSNPSEINEYDNIVISYTSSHPQVEINVQPFVSAVRKILELDRASSPYTSHQIEQDLGEYRRVLNRIYSHQIGIPLVDFSLPH